MTIATHVTGALCWAWGAFLMLSPPWSGSAMLLGVVLWPHAITHVILFRTRAASSQCILLGAFLAYSLWVHYANADILAHPDAQAPIGLLFVAPYALPVLAVAWFTARRLDRRKANTSLHGSTESRANASSSAP